MTSYALWCAATGGDDSYEPRTGRQVDVTEHVDAKSASQNVERSLADNAVLLRVRAGDMAAFDHLVTMYWGILCTFATGYIKDEELAKELVADVFAILWERRAHLQVQTSLEAYLFGAVRNRARTAHRDQVRQTELLRHASAAGEVPAMATPHGAPDVTLERDERILRLQIAVDNLPIRLREATVLRWEREMSYEEISEILAISPAAARQLVSRALRLLRQALAG